MLMYVEFDPVWLPVGFALMLLHNHADFLLQAYQHGWKTWWKLDKRAKRWPWYVDFLPRDSWHIIQFVRNHSVLIGGPVVYYGVYTPLYDPWLGIGFVLLVYGLGRFFGFTLFKPRY